MVKRAISVKAVNVRVGDYLVKPQSNQKVLSVFPYTRRCRAYRAEPDAHKGVVIVAQHPKGYDVQVDKLAGHERVTVRRPKCS